MNGNKTLSYAIQQNYKSELITTIPLITLPFNKSILILARHVHISVVQGDYTI